MSRRMLIALLAVLTCAGPVFAQLPVGRVIPADNFTVAHISAVVHVQSTISPSARVFRVVGCGTSAATAVTPTTGRRDLVLKNVGTVNVYVGGVHATVTTSNAWTLHASSAQPGTAQLYLENFSGQINCIADGPNQTLEIMEVLR